MQGVWSLELYSSPVSFSPVRAISVASFSILDLSAASEVSAADITMYSERLKDANPFGMDDATA